MYNLWAKPRTSGQWLLRSMSWTALCAGSWWLLAQHLGKLPGDGPVVLATAAGTLAQVPLWWAAAGGQAVLAPKKLRWPVVLSWLWWALLHLALLVALGITLLTWLLLAAFSGSSGLLNIH